jgi:hypothetical protein
MNPELSPNYLGPDIHVRPVCSRFYGVHICVVELVTPSRMTLAVPIEIMTLHHTTPHQDVIFSFTKKKNRHYIL